MISIRYRLEFAAISIVAWLARWLPYAWAVSLGRAIGTLAAKGLKLRKSVALDNLQRAYRDKTTAELEHIFIECWRHFGRVGMELARLPRLDLKFIERYVNTDNHTVLENALSQGKGVIMVSGHFGNWEIMGASLALMGYPVTYVVTTQSNKMVELWMDRMRESAGIEIVPRRDALRGVLSALKRNRAVAILCDQAAGEAGVIVPFFGRPASTPRGPAVFHLKTGAPVVFAAAPREDSGRYRLVMEDFKFDDFTGDRESDTQLIMKKISWRLEQEVLQKPEQWLWLHRRWKGIPENKIQKI